MSNKNRQILTVIAALVLALYIWRSGDNTGGVGDGSGGSGQGDRNPSIYQEKTCSGVALDGRQTAEHLGEGRGETPVYGQGEVVKILPDDTKGARHQRFLLRVAPGLVVLVAHNTDIAPKVDGLAAGERLAFCGEYIWNGKGGVLHWTHRDPAGKRPGGWLRLNNKLYR